MNNTTQSQLYLETAMDNWLNAVKTQVLYPQINENWENKHNVPNYYKLEIQELNKFYRIVSSSNNSNYSSWAFVAKQNGHSKALGNYKQGDIFKPASFKTPAKHARGNVFENLPLCNISNWTGPNYL
jgi:hypothetical protein